MFIWRFLQFLAALFVIRLVMRAIGALVRSMAGGAGAPASQRPPAGRIAELVHDRICDVHLPRERAITATIGGKTEYFCSERCRAAAAAGVPRAS